MIRHRVRKLSLKALIILVVELFTGLPIKQMLEADAPADEETVRHVDRCLSCLSCLTTCPSGVHYQHLVDHGRKHIEETYTRPMFDRMIRWTLAWSIPYPLRFRTLLAAASLARPLRGLFRGRTRAMLELALINWAMAKVV